MKTVLFDLDGTLLPMDVEEFTRKYFGAIAKKMKEMNRDDQLILKGIFAGTKAMVKNTSHLSNEEIFWQTFTSFTKIEKEEIEHEFNDFYVENFDEIFQDGKKAEYMIKAVHLLKEKGYRLILATNPLFPRIATEKRIRWAGLEPEDFEYITTYENSTACKPNPDYFKEVILKNDLCLEDCMMVGNDVKEDGVIESLGIPLFLVKDYLLNSDQLPIMCKWQGSGKDFYDFTEKLPDVK